MLGEGGDWLPRNVQFVDRSSVEGSAPFGRGNVNSEVEAITGSGRLLGDKDDVLRLVERI